MDVASMTEEQVLDALREMKAVKQAKIAAKQARIAQKQQVRTYQVEVAGIVV